MLDEAAAGRDVRRGRPDRPAPAGAERLAGGFAGLVLFTWALVVLGALVRAHGAGLACPDWPLCFGELVPRMDVRIAFEWSHRALAGSVALGFAALAVATWRRTSAGDAIRIALALAAALLAAQIVFGALTVWRLLASWTVTTHLLLGNSVAATFAWIGLELRDRRRGAVPARSPATRRERRALATALALLVVQIALGGLVSSRYAGLACPQWPTCDGASWFPTWSGPVGLHLLHRTNAYLLVAALAALAWSCRASSRLAGWTRAAALLGAAQVAVGVANVLARIPVELTGLHSALAAALVLCGTGAARAAWTRAG